jgi:hypothetical protein
MSRTARGRRVFSGGEHFSTDGHPRPPVFIRLLSRGRNGLHAPLTPKARQGLRSCGCAFSRWKTNSTIRIAFCVAAPGPRGLRVEGVPLAWGWRTMRWVARFSIINGGSLLASGEPKDLDERDRFALGSHTQQGFGPKQRRSASGRVRSPIVNRHRNAS